MIDTPHRLAPDPRVSISQLSEPCSGNLAENQVQVGLQPTYNNPHINIVKAAVAHHRKGKSLSIACDGDFKSRKVKWSEWEQHLQHAKAS